jgi:acetyl-CoA carboxylase biotin carboxyl carrier protein
MKLQDIKQLIRVMEKSDIGEIEIEEEGRKIRISKNSSVKQPPVILSSEKNIIPHTINVDSSVQSADQANTETHAGIEQKVSTDNFDKVFSPMVGTFYRAPAPDADPYIEVGDSVKIGQTLCIIEAMKLMNEIQSEVNGIVKKIMVDNAQPVEYNQVLFLIEKS